MNKHYTGEIVEEDDELLMTLPLDMLNQMGWDESTLLEWLTEEGDVFLREVKGEK